MGNGVESLGLSHQFNAADGISIFSLRSSSFYNFSHNIFDEGGGASTKCIIISGDRDHVVFVVVVFVAKKKNGHCRQLFSFVRRLHLMTYQNSINKSVSATRKEEAKFLKKFFFFFFQRIQVEFLLLKVHLQQ